MKTVIVPGCEQVLNGAKLGSNHRWPLWGLQLLALAHWLSTYLLRAPACFPVASREMCAVQFYFYYNILCSAGSACVGV